METISLSSEKEVSTQKPNYSELQDENTPQFTKSFTVDQKEEYLQFFEKWGFVVIREVVSQDQCKATLEMLWEDITEEDPQAVKYTTKFIFDGIEEEGILPFTPVFAPEALDNRTNPKLYEVCQNIIGTGDLLVNHDRFGLFRPTLSTDSEGKVVQTPKFKTSNNLHFDMNPWGFLKPGHEDYSKKCLANLKYHSLNDFIEENNHCFSIFKDTDKKSLEEFTEEDLVKTARKYIQGQITLADNLEEDGGFQLVPGFHKRFIKWATDNYNLTKSFGENANFIWLPKSLPIYDEAYRVTSPAGSIIIWSQLTAHGSSPNNSQNFRYAQFIRMFSKSSLEPDTLENRRKVVQMFVDDLGYNCSDIAKKVLDLK